MAYKMSLLSTFVFMFMLLMHRALACQPVAINGQNYNFDNCEDLSSFTGAPFTFSYTLTGDSLTGAIQSSGNGWSSLAFSDRGMIGADAIILQPDTSSQSGASVDGYHLTSYNAGVINAAKGSFPLTNTAAQKNADGSLSAVFTVTVPSAQSGFIYVVGGALRGNLLGTHVGNGANYGSLPLTLKSSSSTAASTTTASTAATATATTLPTAVSTTVGGGDGEAEAENESTGYGEATTTDSTTTTASPTETKPTTTTTTLPTTTTTTTTKKPTNTSSSACTATINGVQQSYQTCYTVTGVGTDFQVYYTLEKDPNTPTNSILSMAMTATSNGYVSVGFPTRPGRMTDASAVIVQVCPTCATGASAQQYWMSGTLSSDVQPNNALGATDITSSLSSSGQLAASFKVTIPGISADVAAAVAGRRRRRSLFQTQTYPGTATAFPLIYAAGDVTSTGTLLQHYNEGDNTINLLHGIKGSSDASATDGSSADASEIDTGSDLDAYKNAHSWMMAIGWGLLIPVGIVTARYFKHKGSLWFHIHRAVQSFGFIMVVIALALGFVANEGWETDLPVHRDLGIAATALGLVQVISLVARPDPDHKHRYIWNHWHHWIGRSAAILAIANIYYGIIVVDELGVWAWAAYTGVLGAVVLIALVLEIQEWKRKGASVSYQDQNSAKGSVNDNGDTPYAGSIAGDSEYGNNNNNNNNNGSFIVGKTNGGNNYYNYA